MIWTGDIKNLEEFFQYLNSVDANLKFTMNFSKERIHFLGTVVSIDSGILHSDLYIKETDRNTLLRYDSCHPPNMG